MLPSVGWWIVVSITVPSIRRLLPLVTLAWRASCTTPTLRAWTVSGWIVCAHRSNVLAADTASK